MDLKKKSTAIIALAFAGAAAPLFLYHEHQDCYSTKTDCEKDWSSGDCTEDQQKQAPTCRFLGRSYYSWGRSGYGYGSSGSHSTSRVTRGGFGSIGHSLSGGS